MPEHEAQALFYVCDTFAEVWSNRSNIWHRFCIRSAQSVRSTSGDKGQRMSSPERDRVAERRVEFVPATHEEGEVPARASTPAGSYDSYDRSMDDGDTIRRPIQSPPDPNFGRPLRGTQND